MRQQLFPDHAGYDSAETVEENYDNVKDFKDLTVEGYNNLEKSVTVEVEKVTESTHDGIVTPVTVDASNTQCWAIVPYVPKVLPTSEADGIVMESTAATSPQSKPPPSASLGAKAKVLPQPKRKLELEGNQNKKDVRKHDKEKDGGKKKARSSKPNVQQQCKKNVKPKAKVQPKRKAYASKKSKVQPKAKAQFKKEHVKIPKDDIAKKMHSVMWLHYAVK